jgi:hypothetical protein
MHVTKSYLQRADTSLCWLWSLRDATLQIVERPWTHPRAQPTFMRSAEVVLPIYRIYVPHIISYIRTVLYSL